MISLPEDGATADDWAEARRQVAETAAAFEYAMDFTAAIPAELRAAGARGAMAAIEESRYGPLVAQALDATNRVSRTRAAYAAAVDAKAPQIVVEPLEREATLAAEAFELLPWDEVWRERDVVPVIRLYLELAKTATS